MTEAQRWKALYKRFPLITEALVNDGYTLAQIEACIAPEPYRSPVRVAPPAKAKDAHAIISRERHQFRIECDYCHAIFHSTAPRARYCERPECQEVRRRRKIASVMAAKKARREEKRRRQEGGQQNER